MEGADSKEGTAAVSHNAEEGFWAGCVCDSETSTESTQDNKTTPPRPVTRGRGEEKINREAEPAEEREEMGGEREKCLSCHTRI